MNLQARIKGFVTLGQQLSDTNNTQLIEAKSAAYQQNAWFLPEFIDQAIQQIRKQFLQQKALEEWTAAYPSLSDNPTHIKVGIVMAGNIPLVGFHDLLSTLIAGHTAVVKRSSKDQVLMDFIVASLIEINPAFEAQILVQEQLKNCDAYIATGGNTAGNYFEYYFGKFPHIIRKNKTSIAILDGTETLSELASLADDCMLYYGMGCRNVTQIWVPEGYDFIPFLNALKKYNYLQDQHKYKHNYDYQLALLMMRKQLYMDSGGVLMSENPSPFAAISQIHYQQYPLGSIPTFNLDEIQCVVGKNQLPFGSLQKPDLAQYADGVDSLAFLSGLK
jgi:membrane protein YqaA with SNARE-associated domain